MITIIKYKVVLSKLMKQFLFVMSFFICFLSISCKDETVKEETIVTEIEKDTIAIKVKNQEEGDKNQEEEFTYFIEKFSKDSIFQMSRIDFPLTTQLLDDDFKLVKFTIPKHNYLMLNFIYPSDFIEFKHNSIINENEAFIEVRGTGNGIMIDYFFELVDGKWKLKTWIDRST